MAQNAVLLSRDTSGHGTAVTGIAAGNGRAFGGINRGMAPESDLIVVKLGFPSEQSFPRTSELMQALNYVLHKAIEYQKPLSVNLSFGNTYGSHTGDSLLESFMNTIAATWKLSISVGSGNEGAASGHTEGVLRQGEEREIPIAAGAYETGFSVQIWKGYVDTIDISIVHPSGAAVGPIQSRQGAQSFILGTTQILIYYGEPSPYSSNQEIYMDFIPVYDYVDSGVWKIVLNGRQIVLGEYHLWLPSEAALSGQTRFLFPTEDITLTIPSAASEVITVGAYDARNDSYADFSGRGYGNETSSYMSLQFVKPDLVAPGVGIITTSVGGGYSSYTGTSMATPFVTGAAALLMQWGIVNGNDNYLYGEKLKANLRKGARPISGFATFPNPQVGYGALCVRDSIPRG